MNQVQETGSDGDYYDNPEEESSGEERLEDIKEADEDMDVIKESQPAHRNYLPSSQRAVNNTMWVEEMVNFQLPPQYGY